MADLDELRTLAEQVRNASEALELIRLQRDEAIRQVRRSGEHSIPEIAEAAGVSQATVKAVVRGIR